MPNLSSNESARVEDYLNDKIQSPTDLQSLASLLSDLRVQHELQQKQVCLARHEDVEIQTDINLIS